MAKRIRDGQAPSFEQQLKAFKPVKVNPFCLMMDAARTAYDQHPSTANNSSAIQQQYQQPRTATRGHPAPMQQQSFAVPCTHCGCGLSELSVQQCHACKNVYCSSCSVVNYDAREDRVFCLDCHPAAVATCSSHDTDISRHDDDDLIYDSYNMTSPGRNITGSSRSSSMMRACSMAAAAAAASAAHNSSTPFGSIVSSGLGSGSSLGFGAAAATAAWDISGSPPSLHGGQLLATSPVIPFVGLGCNQGYMGLANRVCGAAAVSNC